MAQRNHVTASSSSSSSLSSLSSLASSPSSSPSPSSSSLKSSSLRLRLFIHCQERRFLELISDQRTIGELSSSISDKFRRLYGYDPMIETLKEENGFDLDPLFKIGDVFQHMNHVFVTSSGTCINNDDDDDDDEDDDDDDDGINVKNKSVTLKRKHNAHIKASAVLKKKNHHPSHHRALQESSLSSSVACKNAITSDIFSPFNISSNVDAELNLPTLIVSAPDSLCNHSVKHCKKKSEAFESVCRSVKNNNYVEDENKTLNIQEDFLMNSTIPTHNSQQSVQNNRVTHLDDAVNVSSNAMLVDSDDDDDDEVLSSSDDDDDDEVQSSSDDDDDDEVQSSRVDDDEDNEVQSLRNDDDDEDKVTQSSSDGDDVEDNEMQSSLDDDDDDEDNVVPSSTDNVEDSEMQSSRDDDDDDENSSSCISHGVATLSCEASANGDNDDVCKNSTSDNINGDNTKSSTVEFSYFRELVSNGVKSHSKTCSDKISRGAVTISTLLNGDEATKQMVRQDYADAAHVVSRDDESLSCDSSSLSSSSSDDDDDDESIHTTLTSNVERTSPAVCKAPSATPMSVKKRAFFDLAGGNSTPQQSHAKVARQHSNVVFKTPASSVRSLRRQRRVPETPFSAVSTLKETKRVSSYNRTACNKFVLPATPLNSTDDNAVRVASPSLQSI